MQTEKLHNSNSHNLISTPTALLSLGQDLVTGGLCGFWSLITQVTLFPMI